MIFNGYSYFFCVYDLDVQATRASIQNLQLQLQITITITNYNYNYKLQLLDGKHITVHLVGTIANNFILEAVGVSNNFNIASYTYLITECYIHTGVQHNRKHNQSVVYFGSSFP